MSEILKKLLDEGLKLANEYNQKNRVEAEQFNIFEITSMKYKETWVHTPILRELLDCNGSHAQDNLFFSEFLSLLCKKEYITSDEVDEFSKSGYFCEKEKRIEQGQLDLRLYDNGKFYFIIENKIDAEEGDKQLERYWKYLLGKKHRKKLLIYLTKHGSPPSSISLDKKDRERNILCTLSYIDIKNWLQRANKYVKAPKVKYLLGHYIMTTSEIGGEKTMRGIQQKYAELILSKDDYFRMAIELASIAEKAKETIATDFLMNMKPIFQKELGKEWEVTFYTKGIGLDLKNKDWGGIYHHIDYNGWNFSVGVSNNEEKPLLEEGWPSKEEFKRLENEYEISGVDSGDSWLWVGYTYGKYPIDLKPEYSNNLLKYKNFDSDLTSYFVKCMKDLISISTPLINKIESIS